MQQEPNGVEMIDDEDIAVLAEMINDAFPDEEGVAAETAVAEAVTEDVLAEENAAEDVVAEDVSLEEGLTEAEEMQAADMSDADAGDPVVADVDHLRLIEALLFASPEPLTVNAIRERMPADADVGGLLMELQKTYEGRGVSLLNMEGHWAFRTSADLADALSMKKDVQRKLSKAAMETLAIVAYHQPVTRPEIENIRGVATHKGTIDQLLELGWVKPGKRRETPGRPLTWLSTSAFLDHFGLSTIMELPGLEDLKAAGLLDKRPAIDTVPDNRDLFESADVSAAEVLSGVKDENASSDDDEFKGYDDDNE